jgi:hypothetical protein
MSITLIPRLTGLASAVLLTAGALSAPAAAQTQSAEPVAQNGVCEYGEICLYYGSDATGSLSDFSSDHDIDDYGDSPTDCHKFISPGAGQGQCIKNNAESLVDNSELDVSMHTSGPAEGFDSMSQLFGRTFSYPSHAQNFDYYLKNYNGGHRAFKGI